MARKPRVLYAWNYLEWGGAQVYFLGIARRIKDRADVLFLLPEGTDPQFLDFCRNDGIPFEFFGPPADLSSASGLVAKIGLHRRKLSSEFELVRRINSHGLGPGDAVHVDLSPWQSIGALWAITRKHRVFITMHNRLPAVSRLRGFLWKIKFAVASRLSRLTVFPSNEDAMMSLAPHVGTEFIGRAVVTYTNVNPDEITAVRTAGSYRENVRESLGISSGDKVVMTVGQFIDRKGRWETIGAAARLRESGVRAKFVWISNSVLNDADRAKIEEIGAGDSFRLVQSADAGATHFDLMRYLSAADIFVLASHVEGLPISLLEAMALGIPSVSTSVNAIPEAIIDGETGLLVPPGDPLAIADAVMRLITHPDYARSLAEAGRERVLRKFSEVEVAEIALERYRGLGK